MTAKSTVKGTTGLAGNTFKFPTPEAINGMGRNGYKLSSQ